MARPRKKSNQTLPINLYLGSNGHYKYRHPKTNKFHSMGTDRKKAVAAAKQINYTLLQEKDLVVKVTGNPTIFNTFLDQFENAIVPEKELAAATVKYYNFLLVRIRKELGKKIIHEISVQDISEFLDQFSAKLSNKYRGCLSLIFKHAIAKGLLPDNPAEKTLPRKIKKTRKRLSLKDYLAIYHHPKTPKWLQNAMDMGLQTLQRRKDLIEMKFSDIKEGYLYVIQSKTEKHGEAAHLRIKMGQSLHTVIERCRDQVLSPYIIHRQPDRKSQQNYHAKSKDHPTQITADYLTKAFAEIRDQLDLFKKIPMEDRPTFHEIRSLGIKLYEDQGIDAQALAGHKNRAMTDKYKEGHDIRWTEVCAELSVDVSNG